MSGNNNDSRGPVSYSVLVAIFARRAQECARGVNYSNERWQEIVAAANEQAKKELRQLGIDLVE
jgi:hypothetical protein